MKDESLLNFSIINIDKPSGPTSYTVSEFVKKTLGLSKTSHMGTLDPKVTGVLPITLGRACRLAAYLIRHDKTYVGILHTHKKQNLKKLQKLVDEKFVGKIKQIPPKKSAVKRAEREREVHFFKFLEVSEDGRNFLFECRVEGGTYIRKICSDLGEQIGGAHMGELRRTAAGIFDESTAIGLDEFEDLAKNYKRNFLSSQNKRTEGSPLPRVDGGAEDKKLKKLEKHLIPAEEVIRKILPTVRVKKEAIRTLMQGKPLFKKDLEKEDFSLSSNQCFALFSDNRFIGIYRKTSEKDIFARAEFVYN